MAHIQSKAVTVFLGLVFLGSPSSISVYFLTTEFSLLPFRDPDEGRAKNQALYPMPLKETMIDAGQLTPGSYA